MKILKIEIWRLIQDKKTKEVTIDNAYYTYKVKSEVLEKLLDMKYYKNNPSFMPLDRKLGHKFTMISTNESKDIIDKFEILDIDSHKVSVDDQLIFSDK